MMHETDNTTPDSRTVSTLIADAEERPPTNNDAIDADSLVVVAFHNHEDWLDTVYSDPGGGPDALVCAGEMIRSAAATVATEDETGPTVVDIPSATDVGQIAVEVVDIVDAARETADDIAVVIDGLDVLIDAAGVETTFRLVHVLSGYLRGGADTLTVYLDPTTVDLDTRLVLDPLFDQVIDAEDHPTERREHTTQ